MTQERQSHILELEHMTVVMDDVSLHVTNKMTGNTGTILYQKLENMIEALAFVLTCSPTTCEEAANHVPVPDGWEFDLELDGMIHLRVYDGEGNLEIDGASSIESAETYLGELREMYDLYTTLYR